ncbi:MAG TPA: hypothetical protein EYO73_12310 [Sulfurimonas sp.]|nr:hypothetical protein [Sulfurimonas sp.]
MLPLKASLVFGNFAEPELFAGYHKSYSVLNRMTAAVVAAEHIVVEELAEMMHYYCSYFVLFIRSLYL